MHAETGEVPPFVNVLLVQIDTKIVWLIATIFFKASPGLMIPNFCHCSRYCIQLYLIAPIVVEFGGIHIESAKNCFHGPIAIVRSSGEQG